jgi:hypothetical protein
MHMASHFVLVTVDSCKLRSFIISLLGFIRFQVLTANRFGREPRGNIECWQQLVGKDAGASSVKRRETLMAKVACGIEKLQVLLQREDRDPDPGSTSIGTCLLRIATPVLAGRPA